MEVEHLQPAAKTKGRSMNEERFMAWKLPLLPTGTDIANLVNAGVITKEQAKQVLFHTEHRQYTVTTPGTEKIHISGSAKNVKYVRELLEN